MTKKSNKYWIKRAEDNVKEYHKDVDKTMKTLNNAYNNSLDRLNAQIKNIYANFKISSGLTDKEVIELLNTKISAKEMNDLRRQVMNIKDEELKKYLLARYNSQAYKARMTRCEAIKQSLYIETKQLYSQELQQAKRLFIGLINKAYYKNIYDIQKGIKLGFDVAEIPTQRINYILNYNWSGKHYSKRLWLNNDVFAQQVEEIVLDDIMSGKRATNSAEKLAMFYKLEEQYNNIKFATERLLRTETTYMVNMAEMESYKECDIEKYKFVATLDKRTTKMCQKRDGKIIKVSEAKAGINMPPLHAFCRSTTVAYFDYIDYSNLQRRARDKDDKPILVPSNMPYKEWENKYAK